MEYDLSDSSGCEELKHKDHCRNLILVGSVKICLSL